MSEPTENAGEHHDAHDTNYTKIYYTLLVLLVISVAGPFIGILWVTLITAFGIAGVKAYLVVQNFMHLRPEKVVVKWALASSLAFMGLFFFGVAPDVMRHSGTNWVNTAAIAAVERGIPQVDHGEGEEEHAVDEHAEDGAPGATEAVVAAEPQFDAAGAYASVCSLCHGTTGAGDGPGGAALDPKPADFTDAEFWATRDDAVVVQAIREGGPAVGKSALMPPWGALYDEAQAQAIVDYLKTFGG